MTKNSDVAKAFYHGEEEKTEYVFSENQGSMTIIYSYGYHFPMAIRFNDGFLYNKSKYSPSTSKQQSYVRNEIINETTEKDYSNTEELKEIIRKDFSSKAEYFESLI